MYLCLEPKVSIIVGIGTAAELHFGKQGHDITPNCMQIQGMRPWVSSRHFQYKQSLWKLEGLGKRN